MYMYTIVEHQGNDEKLRKEEFCEQLDALTTPGREGELLLSPWCIV